MPEFDYWACPFRGAEVVSPFDTNGFVFFKKKFCMHTCLGVYVCVWVHTQVCVRVSLYIWESQRKVLSADSSSPLFLINLNQGILLNLGLGLLAWLAASNLGIFLIQSHSVLRQSACAGPCLAC